MITNKVCKRLGCELEFDGDKERDLINAIDTLAGRKDLGHLVSHLLRLAFESPEVYGNGQEVRQLIDKMSGYGMSPTRFKYFEQVSKDIEAMKCKIDAIYDMAYKVYMLAEMNKQLGLSEKSTNLLSSSFILERQISSLCMALGVDNLNHTFVSNKLEDTKKRADSVLEYILTCYEGIMGEYKREQNDSEIAKQIAVAVSEGIKEALSNINESVKQPIQLEKCTENKGSITRSVDDINQNSADSSIDDEIIDLTENPNKAVETKDAGLEIKVPTGDVADQFRAWVLD